MKKGFLIIGFLTAFIFSGLASFCARQLPAYYNFRKK